MDLARFVFTNTSSLSPHLIPVFENNPVPIDITQLQNGMYAVQLDADGFFCDQKFPINQ
jgi:hypothetical protein